MSMSESGRPVVDGRFELVSRLGSGGMGTVWRARDLALDREVALKEVRPPDPAAEQATPGLTAQLRERAVREARALARLSNRHVVTIHHIVEPADGAHPWIVMELVEGRSVYDRLTDGPMPVDEVVRLGLQVLSALRAAHAAGIQHRDVKPANVLLRPDGSAVLTDFGIAAMQDATTRLTSTGDLIGSPEFIAPERIRGEEGNPASDLWSLGMLLYVAAEGHHPLRRATNLATSSPSSTTRCPPLVRSGVLAPVLTRVLQRDPALRPDGAELERLLRAAAGQAEAAPAAPAPAAPLPAGQAPAAAPTGTPPQSSVPPGGPGGRTPRRLHAHGPPYRSAVRAGPRARARTPPPCTTAPPRGSFGPPVPPRDERRAAPPRRAVLASAAVVALAVAGAVYGLPGGGTGDGARGLLARRDRRHRRRRRQGRAPGPPPRTPAPPRPPRRRSTRRPGQPAHHGERPRRPGRVPRGERLRAGHRTHRVRGLRAGLHPHRARRPYLRRVRVPGRGRPAYRPGGTISSDSADEQPFDVAALAWDRLPDLMKQAERDLGVDDPTMRYVIVDRWTFNGDEPTMRFYLTNEYRASGYLAADRTGKVVATHPRPDPLRAPPGRPWSHPGRGRPRGRQAEARPRICRPGPGSPPGTSPLPFLPRSRTAGPRGQAVPAPRAVSAPESEPTGLPRGRAPAGHGKLVPGQVGRRPPTASSPRRAGPSPRGTRPRRGWRRSSGGRRGPRTGRSGPRRTGRAPDRAPWRSRARAAANTASTSSTYTYRLTGVPPTVRGLRKFISGDSSDSMTTESPSTSSA